jgi:hypothetical protein
MQAFAIFKQRVAGRQDQEGTAPAALAGNDILMSFDNTNGNVTAMAIVNPGSTSQTYPATIRVGANPSLNFPGLNSSQTITVPAGGHLAFPVTQQFPNQLDARSPTKLCEFLMTRFFFACRLQDR